MAMDHLLIQYSAVLCEHIFLSSAKTDTKKRNHISPLLLEALQMLKFHLKKEQFNFTMGCIMSEKQMVDDDPDEALLCKLLEGDYQDALDSAICSVNDNED
jgi:hypothetical protein